MKTFRLIEEGIHVGAGPHRRELKETAWQTNPLTRVILSRSEESRPSRRCWIFCDPNIPIYDEILRCGSE